jgi:hypothetical protein
MSTLKTVAKWVGLYVLAQVVGGLVEAATHSPEAGVVVTVGIVIVFIAYAWRRR